MAYTYMTGTINPGDTDFQKWAKLQGAAWLACSNAGISINTVSNPLLLPLAPGANEWQKFASVQAMLTNLSSGLSPAASGVQSGNQAVTTSATSQVIAFATGFAAAPAVVASLVAPGGGATVLENVTGISATGFTANWGFAIPSGYSLSWIATPKTQ
jgi:hypothetical protein